MRTAIRLLDRYFEEAVCAVLLCILMSFLIIQVVLRYVFHMSLAWNEELTRFAFVWFIYLGASMGVQREGHIRVLTFLALLPGGFLKTAVLLISDLLWFAFMAVVFWFSFDFLKVVVEFPRGSAVLDIPMLYVFMIIPGGFLLMMLRLIQLHLRNWGVLNDGHPPSVQADNASAAGDGGPSA